MSDGVFSHYARYYDLFYRDKNYAGETRLVDGLLRPAGTSAGALLDVGCGTGVHAREFAKLGWRVTGVDLSPRMIEIARARTGVESGVSFVTGAAAEFDLGRTFPAAVSLFHVASYQAGTGEAGRMLANVRRHLAVGGVFVFDFWHGPGVLADPPAVRLRHAADDRIRVTRIAKPTHRPEECVVDVNYEVEIEDIATGATERFEELHRMRYFFLPELESLLGSAGFSLERTQAGLSEAELTPSAWYGLVVARAI